MDEAQKRPAWCGEAVSDDDLACIRAQLGRSVRGVAGVVVRCRYGRPQVIATYPLQYDGEGVRRLPPGELEPERLGVFPTLYWLTCPMLVRSIGRLEAAGWIRRIKEEVAANPVEREELIAAHRETARLRRRLVDAETAERLEREFPGQYRVLTTTGVGGIRFLQDGGTIGEPGVKCLHTHFADYLARGKNPVGRRVWGLLTAAGVDPRGWGPCFQEGACACPAAEGEDAGGRPSALIDIGSNSVRLFVGRVDEQGRIHAVARALETTRLLGGRDDAEGRLAPAGVEATLQVLRAYRRRAEELGAGEPYAWGTAALREASDRARFLVRAWEEAGCSVRVLGGDEEAALSFRGALAAVRFAPQQAILLADVGGGSTDLVLGSGAGSIVATHSLAVGAVRWARAFPAPEDRGAMRERTRQLLRAGIDALRQADASGQLAEWLAFAPLRLVAVGGTATTLAAVELGLTEYDPERVNGCAIPFGRVRHWLDHLAALTPEERARVPGLPPQRADIIVHGLTILAELAEAVTAAGLPTDERLVVADADLLQGALLRLAGA